MRQAQMYSIGDLDEYGQETISTDSTTVSLTFGLFNHHDTEDLRYQDVEYCGLTYDNITDKNILLLDDTNYKVKFVNPYGRMKEVFLITIIKDNIATQNGSNSGTEGIESEIG